MAGAVDIVENVPVGVCMQCGERYLFPEVAKTVDRVLEEKQRPRRVVEVPVYEYGVDVA